MKRIKYLNSRVLSLFVLGIIILSLFLMKADELTSVNVQAIKPLLSISKESPQISLEVTNKNISDRTGKILSIQSGGGYFFIEVELPSKKLLHLASANLPNKLLVGNDVHWKNPRLAKNYYSHALKQHFDRLYMVTIKDDSIKFGVVTSVKRVEENIFLSVRQKHSTQKLIVKNDHVAGELSPGSIIKWQHKSPSSRMRKQPEKKHLLPQLPLMVDWIRISKN